MKTVRETARLSGVSVRTLHYYDSIGLLRPAGTTEAGYRLYGEEELKGCSRFCSSGSSDSLLRTYAEFCRTPASIPGRRFWSTAGFSRWSATVWTACSALWTEF